MDLQNAIKQLESHFDTTENGKAYKEEMEALDKTHEALTVKVNDLSKKKRANRRKYKALQDKADSERNDYIVEQLAKLDGTLQRNTQPNGNQQ